MKVKYKPAANVEIEIEAASIKDIFQQQALVDEVFKVVKCGDRECGATDLQHIFREVKKHPHFELRCNKCFKKLTFSKKTGEDTIYPRRRYHDKHPLVKAGRVKEGDAIPHGGWEKFERVEEAD